MKKQIVQHVQECEICQMNKGEHVASPGLLEPIPILEGAWEVITMDFVGGLPKSEGKDVIMVIIDKLTKYYYLLSLSHPFKAVTIYKLHGLPQRIITNRDPIFTSHFWKELMGKLGISLNFSTLFHPQIDGQSEKLNQCVETYLRCMAFDNPKKMDEVVVDG
jgi:hypothetical protein